MRRRRSERARTAFQPLRATALVAALLASPALSACNGAGGGGGAAHAVSEHPLLGVAAPALEVPTPDGKGRVTLAEHAGKVVVVDFWATWCEPCRKSFPAYQKLTQDFAGKVVVLGVSVDESPGDIPAFAKATGAKFPIGWDEGQTAARSYEPPKMPTSFIVDSSGIIRFVHAGFSPGDEAGLREELKSLM
ncbi:MAG TPA: TlpA disulfide reductase family protein [Polyangiaceae bacterium]|jgi:peroxiredoxin|nr:TlpA disulfide reductase family protein [Polyangiaceae bacterium]